MPFICPKCKNPVDPHETSCKQCGFIPSTKITPEQIAAASAPKMESADTPIAYVILGSLIILAYAVFLFFFNTVLFYLMLATTIWVGVDSSTLMRSIPIEDRLAISSFAKNPWHWIFSMAMLWIITFPWYLAKRGAYVRYLNAHSSTK